MKKAIKATDFLQNMAEAEPLEPAASSPANHAQSNVARPGNKREGLKHIGGYLAPDIVEKVAILRARLRLDNSELLTLAISELHAKHNAKRAFGEA